ncbi:MAG: TIGR01212 family radical SAM protein [Candidatus Stygibacter australis]|nr:TIGR01212 family radical SAM protein [Candidatus Stygibacter australis]MDP8323138.1 TIGR01212 family radical SAM protein [Candidatus Stygibacter australis]
MQLSDLINTYSKAMLIKYGEKVFRVGVSTGIICPHRAEGGCLFCNPQTFRGAYQAEELTIETQLEKGINILKQNSKAKSFIAYFQDETSSAGEIDYLKDVFSRAINYPEIKGLTISTRPDYVNEELCELLGSFNKPVSIEIGMQSIHDSSLQYLERGHSHHDTIEAIELCRKWVINTGVHLIMGIPGESRQDMIDTIRWVSDNKGIQEIKLHNLVIYSGTRLGELWEKGEVKQMPIDEYIEILSELIPWVREDIVISRLFTSNILHNDLGVEPMPGNKTKWMNQLLLKLIKKQYRQGSSLGDG